MTEESDLLKRLNPAEAASYQEKHSCMEGTRTAVLDEIVAWAKKPFDSERKSNDSSMFWLYGMPGLGKTSVANSLCDRLGKGGNLGGSFICKHDNPSLREPEAVLPTLIAQLVRMWGPFRKLVAQVLHDEPQINPTSTKGDLLLKPLRLLKKHPLHPLVLVIDALDECGKHNTRGPLLNCLVEACSLVHWLKIVVTSRPESDIISFFDARNITGRDLGTDDLAYEDIHLFTRRRLGSVAKRRHLPFDWPGEESVNKIVERSNGLFIFVETLYRLVDIPEPEPLLVQVLSGESQGADTTLHQLYSMAITTRIAQPTPAFHSILRTIIAISVNRPLCDETLAELIGLKSRVVRSWVDELSSLLYRDHSNKGGIRVRHLSILEFLVGSRCPAEFRVDLNLINAELARCCLETMVNLLKFNICELETSYLPNAEIEDLNDRVEQKIPDVLQYSCIYWHNHLCYEGGPISAEIARLLDGFFAESQPLYWFEVLSLMGKVPVAISALRLMKANFKVCMLTMCINIS
jgi:NACHT domain